MAEKKSSKNKVKNSDISNKNINDINIEELLNASTEAHIITKSGSWYSYGKNKMGNGKKAALKYISDNPDVEKALREKLIKKEERRKKAAERRAAKKKENLQGKVFDTKNDVVKGNKHTEQLKDKKETKITQAKPTEDSLKSNHPKPAKSSSSDVTDNDKNKKIKAQKETVKSSKKTTDPSKKVSVNVNEGNTKSKTESLNNKSDVQKEERAINSDKTKPSNDKQQGLETEKKTTANKKTTHKKAIKKNSKKAVDEVKNKTSNSNKGKENNVDKKISESEFVSETVNPSVESHNDDLKEFRKQTAPSPEIDTDKAKADSYRSDYDPNDSLAELQTVKSLNKSSKHHWTKNLSKNKIVGILIIAIVAVIGLFCYTQYQNNLKAQPDARIEQAVQLVSTGQFDDAKEYASTGSYFSSLDLIGNSATDQQREDIAKLLFDDMDFKVTKVSVNKKGTEAKITAKVKNYNVYSAALSVQISNEEMKGNTAAENRTLLVKKAKKTITKYKKSAKKVSNTVHFNLIKKDGQWVVDGTDSENQMSLLALLGIKVDTFDISGSNTAGDNTETEAQESQDSQAAESQETDTSENNTDSDESAGSNSETSHTSENAVTSQTTKQR